jgi:ComF family protein
MQIEKTVYKPILELPFSRWRIIDLVYPPFCCNCGKIGYEICPECYSRIEIISNQKICLVCGGIIETGSNCSICMKLHPLFEQARSWGVYVDVLKQIVQKIKYKRGFGIIEYITKPIIHFIKNWEISVDMIVPIPLGKKREIMRGYNQSILIAKPISEYFSIPMNKYALIRSRDTKSQVGLNYEERKMNMKNAFRADKPICNDKSILLIDDIATTCSTLNESAKALKLAGAQNVFCFTVARTKNPIK